MRMSRVQYQAGANLLGHARVTSDLCYKGPRAENGAYVAYHALTMRLCLLYNSPALRVGGNVRFHS